MVPLHIILAALAGVAAPAAAADWKLSASAVYETGDYGTGSPTDSLYVPFTLKRYYDYADFSVTLPYLRQSSTGSVTRVGGRAVRAAARPSTAGSKVSASGPGDILVRGSYELRREGPARFGLSLAGKLKLPTASRHKGLGTGEMDEGAGLEFSKKVSPRWSLLADGYFTIIGDPPGTDYDNELALDFGFYGKLRGDLYLTALYETASAMIKGGSDPRDINCTLEYAAPDGYRYSGGLTLGLSDGSPDLGLSAGVSRRF